MVHKQPTQQIKVMKQKTQHTALYSNTNTHLQIVEAAVTTGDAGSRGIVVEGLIHDVVAAMTTGCIAVCRDPHGGGLGEKGTASFPLRERHERQRPALIQSDHVYFVCEEDGRGRL